MVPRIMDSMLAITPMHLNVAFHQTIKSWLAALLGEKLFAAYIES